MSRRDTVLVALVVPVSAAVLNLVGPRYLQPLPMWTKLIVLTACACLIGTIAIYGRSRARRV